MSEDKGEPRRIFIANKRGREVATHRPELKENAAVNGRPFWDIQHDLSLLLNTPDPKKMADLKEERAHLIADAKSVGVFDTIKKEIADIQANNLFSDAARLILDIPVADRELEAHGISGWKREFEGMIGEYRDGAIRNMAHARLRVSGNGNTQTATDLKNQIDTLGWGSPPRNLEILARRDQVDDVDALNQVGQGIDRLVSIAGAQRNLAEMQLEALQRGYADLVGLTETKTAFNPDTWETNPPFWYEKLSRDEREAVKAVLIFNYISGTMIRTGEASYGPWAALGDPEKGYTPLIRAEAIQFQFKNFPGFRIALATMTHDIFENRLDTEGLYISDNGYLLMSNSKNFIQYKKDLIQSLLAHFNRDQPFLTWCNDRRLKPEEAATLVVSMVDNFLMGTTSYLSGDMRRPYDPIDNELHNGRPVPAIDDPSVNGGDDIRAVLLPGLKLGKKIIQQDEGFETKEEYWLGKIGEWLRFNAINDIDGFRTDYVEGRIRYIPKKLFPGLLEFVTLKDGGAGHTAAKLLVGKDRVVVPGAVGNVRQLFDYLGGGNAIDFTKGSEEWFGEYVGKRVQAIKVFENLSSTGGQRTTAMTVEQFFNALARVRKMPVIRDNLIPELREAWYSKEFIIMNLAAIISKGEGLILGIREMVLNIDPRLDYDTEVNAALSGQANVFGRQENGVDLDLTRSELLRTFNATDMARFTPKSIITALGFGETLLSRRFQLRRKAVRNTERVAKRH